jgi:hypothetical protein
MERLMKFAYYTATKKIKFVTITTAHNGPEFAAAPRIEVKGKLEARKVAAAHNAQPWNF